MKVDEGTAGLSSEGNGGNGPLLRERAAVALDPLEFVERLRGEIALSAVRAGDDGDVLDHEQGRPPAVCPGKTPLEHPLLPAYVATLLRALHCCQRVYTCLLYTSPSPRDS